MKTKTTAKARTRGFENKTTAGAAPAAAKSKPQRRPLSGRENHSNSRGHPRWRGKEMVTQAAPARTNSDSTKKNNNLGRARGSKKSESENEITI